MCMYSLVNAPSLQFKEGNATGQTSISLTVFKYSPDKNQDFSKNSNLRNIAKTSNARHTYMNSKHEWSDALIFI